MFACLHDLTKALIASASSLSWSLSSLGLGRPDADQLHVADVRDALTTSGDSLTSAEADELLCSVPLHGDSIERKGGYCDRTYYTSTTYVLVYVCNSRACYGVYYLSSLVVLFLADILRSIASRSKHSSYRWLHNYVLSRWACDFWELVISYLLIHVVNS